ncbi:uncharacterized protein LOC110010453 [Jatropha curcas]|uniref:uncharacterized protein LOC110010453 n=1 Tax=Jatropha curcas TaxID=180498 RepID=UPI0018950222|nr:uncharacterized protein LOC110010453 [Jatropha curcas]
MEQLMKKYMIIWTVITTAICQFSGRKHNVWNCLSRMWSIFIGLFPIHFQTKSPVQMKCSGWVNREDQEDNRERKVQPTQSALGTTIPPPKYNKYDYNNILCSKISFLKLKFLTAFNSIISDNLTSCKFSKEVDLSLASSVWTAHSKPCDSTVCSYSFAVKCG